MGKYCNKSFAKRWKTSRETCCVARAGALMAGDISLGLQVRGSAIAIALLVSFRAGCLPGTARFLLHARCAMPRTLRLWPKRASLRRLQGAVGHSRCRAFAKCPASFQVPERARTSSQPRAATALLFPCADAASRAGGSVPCVVAAWKWAAGLSRTRSRAAATWRACTRAARAPRAS